MSEATPYVFISYASRDRERVLPIVERLEAAGVRVWIDREGISGGANYALEIAEAIEGATALLLMCSEASLSSRNVKQEIALGWRFEKPYLPLLLEQVEIPKDVAYWLEAAQWVEVLEQPEQVWWPKLLEALARLGIDCQRDEAKAVRARPLLVGREREQAILSEHLGRMLDGQGSVLLVGGEAGIGKTTLVDDLSVRAEAVGALVLWGHAYDLSVTPPYGPWLEIFRQYRPTEDASLPPLPGFIGNAEELAKVGSQETLFAAVMDLLFAVAAQRPLLLVLDDLHWFDQASLDFIRSLARQLNARRVLLVATYRSDELHRHHPLFSLIPLLVREAGAVRLDIRPLDANGHQAFIRGHYTLAEADQRRLERYLEDHAEGNPLYAGELLRTLEDAQVLKPVEDGWTLGDLAQVRLPPLLRQVIEGRLARLHEDARQLLQMAAVIGQDVPTDLWQQVSGASDEALIEAIEQGRAAQLLEEVGGTSYRFRHALLREALYEEVIAFRRRIWHRQIAEVRANLPNPDPDQIAYHFQQAGDARAVDWLLQAAQRAIHAFTPRMAADRLEAVVALYQEQGRSSTSYYKLLFTIGSLRRYASDQRTIAYLTEVATAAREAGDLFMAALADAERGLSRFMLGEFRDGLIVLERAVDEGLRVLAQDSDVLNQSVGPIDVWDADSYQSFFASRTSIQSAFLAYVGRLGEALAVAEPFIEELFDTSVERTEPLPKYLWHDGVPYLTSNLAFGIAIAYAALGQIERARQMFRTSERRFRANNSLHLVSGTRVTALYMFVLPYDPATLAAETQVALATWTEALGIVPEGIDQRVPELRLLVLAGRWPEATTIAREARGLAGAVMHEQLNEATIAPVLRHQGRRDEAWRAVASLFPDGAQTEPGNVVLLAALPLQRLAARLALDARDFPTARAWLEAHDRWLEWSGAVLGRAEGALGWAEYYHVSGDPGQARAYAEQALAHATEPRQPLALLAAHRFLGKLDTEGAQLTEAEAHLHESLRLAEACSAPFERALTLLEIARLRMAQGQADKARVLLAEVRAICETLEARPTLERVAALEHELDGQG